MSHLRRLLKRFAFALYYLGLRSGVHVVPVHFYNPLPNHLELEKTRNWWAKPSSLPGITIDLDKHAQALTEVCSPYLDEYRDEGLEHKALMRAGTSGFGELEGAVLHCVIRTIRPKRIVEVGGGTSTQIARIAADYNRDDDVELISIEPYPSAALYSTPGVTLIPQPVQSVSPSLFADLRENDLLFIDSSHVVRPGGDVNHLILEVLPTLRAGVIVHFHDIYLPYDYPRYLLKHVFAATETSLLRAFLTFNNRTCIWFCMSLLHYERPEVLRNLFPSYEPQPDKNGLRPDDSEPFSRMEGHFPCSVYLRM